MIIEIKKVKVHVWDILDLMLNDQAVLIRATDRYMWIADDPKDPLGNYVVKVTVDKKEFEMIKFNFIKYIKTNPLAGDRVAYFEWHDRETLIPDFEKLDKLIESRKTSKEKRGDNLLKEMLQRSK